MIANELIEEVKATQQLSDSWKKKIDQFVNDTLKVVINFIGNQKKVSVGGYTITKKHPWFLAKSKYGDELIIRSTNKIIVSWLEDFTDWRTGRWMNLTFDYNDVENIKDFLCNLRSFMDIDLLEIKFDGIEEDDEKRYRALENNIPPRKRMAAKK